MLITLLVGEGVTILDLRPLVDEHMFIALVLVPPVLLKWEASGTGSSAMTRALACRPRRAPRGCLCACSRILVAATIALLPSGVLVLASGHESRSLPQIHQASAIVWATVFAVHFLAYIPRVARSLATALRATPETAVPGAGVRGVLVAGATGGGVALAVALRPVISGWHG